MLRVRLFGGLALALGERSLALPERRHARLLLAYIALHPGAHARSDLAAVLWPDVSPDSARGSLRTALVSLRQALGPAGAHHLLASREIVALDAAWVDAVEFGELVRAAELERALELANGEFLQGLEAGWVEAARAAHDEKLDAVLTTLATSDDATTAVRYARRRVALDPLAEAANRELMRCLVSAGDPAAALAVYRRLAERLREEFGIVPSRESRALARDIRLAAEDDADGDLALPGAIARAAVAATAAGAHDDAAALYDRASRLVDASVTSALRRRGELLVALALARLRAAQATEVREPALAAAEVALRIGDGGLLADAVLALCSVPFFPSDEPVDVAAVGFLRRALELTPASERGDRARLLARLAAELYFVGGEGEVDRLAADALSLARAAGDDAALAAALSARHLALATSAAADARLQLSDEAIAAADRAGLAETALRARALRGVDLAELGRLDAQAAEGELVEQLAAEREMPAYRWWPMLWRAARAIGDGELEAGAKLADEALARGRDAFGEAAELEHRSQRLWLAWRRGELVDRLHDLESLAQRYPALPSLHCALALGLALAGRRSDAAALVSELTGCGLERVRTSAGWLVAAVLLGEAARALDDSAAARLVADALRPHAASHVVSAHGSVWLGPVSGWLARFDATEPGLVGSH